MSATYEKSLLFAQFLRSDTKHWIRFVPALPFRAAYYYDFHDKYAGVLHRFVLELTKQQSEVRSLCLVELGIASHTPIRGGGLALDVASTSREIPIELPDINFAAAKWPTLEDPLVRKAHQIVVTCIDRYGPSPTTAPAYVH